ncbi:hypothetical protein AJ79_04101 [Helicocarpus griseus UAMH5409]|uniref:PNPLA domain-containing protein n=1 Tax=Helicocarpus griseus UAMH5409 TaxID=1447875 RepID=A0A2B7XUR4_9EURO|nr:hypothetical protein AJ79_04101 [Helicocarpus griseus UAMH5409]
MSPSESYSDASTQGNLEVGQQNVQPGASQILLPTRDEVSSSRLEPPNPTIGRRRLTGHAVRRGPRREYSDVSDEEPASPWARKTALSFDGGGIRGYSSLLILKELMVKIRAIEKESGFKSSSDYRWGPKTPSRPSTAESNIGRQERVDDFLPCHYFDYIIGTSTGGLSAILLGRLRMTVDEALDHYHTFGNMVFGKPRLGHERSFFYLPRSKYSSKRVREAIITVILSKLQQTNPKADYSDAQREQFKSPKDQTRTIVLAFCKNRSDGTESTYLWRTYDHRGPTGQGERMTGFHHKNPSSAHQEPLWQVARSTSAAPMYFEAIKIGDRKFFDGAFGANNPSSYGVQEIILKHIHPPSFFLSIGTGIKRKTPKKKKMTLAKELLTDRGSRKQFLKKYLEISRLTKDLITDTEEVVRLWSGICNQSGTDHERLNVPEGVSTIPLDHWKPSKCGTETLHKIKEHTLAYLKTQKAQQALDSSARKLVTLRHRRADTERWEVFATDVTYCCPSLDCRKQDACHYNKRHKLRSHFEYKHRDIFQDHPDDLEALLDAGRIVAKGDFRSKDVEAAEERLSQSDACDMVRLNALGDREGVNEVKANGVARATIARSIETESSNTSSQNTDKSGM